MVHTAFCRTIKVVWEESGRKWSRLGAAKKKHERLEARISLEQKQLFKRAAEIQHRSLTDFVLAAVQEKATKVIQEHEIMQLTAKDQKVFMDALLNPPEPNAKLRRAAKRYLAAVRAE